MVCRFHDGDDDDDDNDSNCHTDDNSHLRNKETNLVRYDPSCNVGEVVRNIPSCPSTFNAEIAVR